MHRKSQQVLQEREKDFEQLKHSMTSLTVSKDHHTTSWPLSAIGRLLINQACVISNYCYH